MIEWMEQLGEAERAEVIRSAFQDVANTQAGTIVFAVLFEHLYFFRPCPDAASQALANYAKAKLLDYFGEGVQARIMDAIIESAKHASVKRPDKAQGDRNG